MKNPIINLNLKVVDLINLRTRVWDRNKLKDLFYQEDILRIQKMKLMLSKEEFWVWKYNRGGEYSV